MIFFSLLFFFVLLRMWLCSIKKKIIYQSFVFETIVLFILIVLKNATIFLNFLS